MNANPPETKPQQRTALMGGTLQQIYNLAVPDLVSSPPAALNDTRSGTLFAP
jgi:hypothetical protein